MDWDTVIKVSTPILAFFIGVCTALWKVFSMFGRLELVEQRMDMLERDINESKRSLVLLEERIMVRLDRLENKLDKYYDRH